MSMLMTMFKQDKPNLSGTAQVYISEEYRDQFINKSVSVQVTQNVPDHTQCFAHLKRLKEANINAIREAIDAGHITQAQIIKATKLCRSTVSVRTNEMIKQ